ncbi:SH3 domain-containing protein [Cellulosimicrobium sp. Marseille-Q4280]|uniref:SH3 domain-containing protein n=1 Tax=Cellulosimicrobium sp. Marseille-Q4280 TaxID=2937992 RepID=UPI00203F6622|nr:SH3 domain-containing protein [Cellulosimicrobium sp. Marseille-Q4280]
MPAVTGQLWTTDSVNVRTGPSADAERVTTVPLATVVDVTGTAQDGWNQVVWEGAVAWVSSSFLSETEPTAAAPASAAGTSGAACSVSPGIESGLQSNATAVYRSVCAAFPQVTAYGGPRPGDSGDHGTGRAVDIMISGDLGWDIARYVQANAGSLGVTYVIYQQQMWMAGDPAGAWRAMEDRGGVTANHYDHVHVSTS